MASLDMTGPFDLSVAEIGRQITQTQAGNYALGKMDGATFIVQYVGRSDSDVANRLKQHVGKYSKFKFSYATSPKAAFEKECRNFHDFGGVESLGNKIHPDRPANSGWKCPVCNIFN